MATEIYSRLYTLLSLLSIYSYLSLFLLENEKKKRRKGREKKERKKERKKETRRSLNRLLEENGYYGYKNEIGR